MLKFRSLDTLRKFVKVQGTIHNHFNLDRHLVSRTVYKQQRSTALAEWKPLASKDPLLLTSNRPTGDEWALD